MDGPISDIYWRWLGDPIIRISVLRQPVADVLLIA